MHRRRSIGRSAQSDHQAQGQNRSHRTCSIPPAERAAAEAIPTAETEEQAEAFESGVPSARVVILPHANHYVFLSNEADVLREMRAFLAGLH